jgi:hypothetical protein
VKDEYYSDFLNRKTGLLSRDEFVYGGNMGIRKNILRCLGGFNINLGMKGNKLAFAEEVELQQRALECNPTLEIFFDSKLWLHHHVRKEKVNLKWMLNYNFLMGLRGFEVLNGIKAYKRLPIHRKFVRIMQFFVGILYRIIRICARLLVLVFWRGEKYPYWQQYLVERIFGIEVIKIGVYYAGIVHALCSLRGKETYAQI